MAVKQVEIPRTANNQNESRNVLALKQESDTLQQLDHPNIVQYLGYEEASNFLSMCVEVFAAETLF